MQNGGVVFAAELASDFRERRGGELLDDVHGDLARIGDGFCVGADFQILLAKTELFADAFLDELDGDLFFLGGNDVAKDLLRIAEIERDSRERCVGDQASERAFEFADVGFDGARDKFGDIVGQNDAIVFGFFLKDRDFGFEIGRLNIGDKSPLEARAQALFNRGNIFRRTIAEERTICFC